MKLLYNLFGKEDEDLPKCTHKYKFIVSDFYVDGKRIS